MQTRTLGDEAVKSARLARLQEPNIAPLTVFAERIRRTSNPHEPYWAPCFDPKSGGTGAQVLLLMESPGPKVSQTGFVSLDNPDGTAENLSCLLKLAGLPRAKVLLWNIFPWQLSAEKVVMPTDDHLLEAVPATLELLSVLPQLRVVVLVGARAQRGWLHVKGHLASAPATLNCPHPSPQNLAARPQQAARAIEALAEAAALVRQQPRP